MGIYNPSLPSKAQRPAQKREQEDEKIEDFCNKAGHDRAVACMNTWQYMIHQASQNPNTEMGMVHEFPPLSGWSLAIAGCGGVSFLQK